MIISIDRETSCENFNTDLQGKLNKVGKKGTYLNTVEATNLQLTSYSTAKKD